MIEALQRATDILESLIIITIIGLQTLALLFVAAMIVGVLRISTRPKGGKRRGD